MSKFSFTIKHTNSDLVFNSDRKFDTIDSAKRAAAEAIFMCSAAACAVGVKRQLKEFYAVIERMEWEHGGYVVEKLEDYRL